MIKKISLSLLLATCGAGISYAINWQFGMYFALVNNTDDTICAYPAGSLHMEEGFGGRVCAKPYSKSKGVHVNDDDKFDTSVQGMNIVNEKTHKKITHVEIVTGVSPPEKIILQPMGKEPDVKDMDFGSIYLFSDDIGNVKAIVKHYNEYTTTEVLPNEQWIPEALAIKANKAGFYRSVAEIVFGYSDLYGFGNDILIDSIKSYTDWNGVAYGNTKVSSDYRIWYHGLYRNDSGVTHGDIVIGYLHGVPGSYTKKCSDIKYEDGILTAYCEDKNAQKQPAGLGYKAACRIGATVSVDENGQLLCDNSRPIGSYLASCGPVTWTGSQLRAVCDDSSGNKQHSVLQYNLYCDPRSTVSNHNGQLVCDDTIGPKGSYLKSCGSHTYLDGVLKATCDTSAGNKHRSTLDYVHDCDAGSTVSNHNGRLKCDNPIGPEGSYLAKCVNVQYSNGILTAHCDDKYGIDRGTQLNYEKCKKDDLVDVDDQGQLFCIHPKPRGSYLKSCGPITWLGDIQLLKAMCDDKDGNKQHSKLKYGDKCADGSTVSNHNGRLSCDRKRR